MRGYNQKAFAAGEYGGQDQFKDNAEQMLANTEFAHRGARERNSYLAGFAKTATERVTVRKPAVKPKSDKTDNTDNAKPKPTRRSPSKSKSALGKSAKKKAAVSE